jgi:hypothetical protein
MTTQHAGQAGSGELRAALYAAGCALADQAARTKGAASFELGDTRDAFKARAADEAAKAIAVLELADSHASLSAEKEALQAKNAELSRLLDEQTNLALTNHTNLSAENATLREQRDAMAKDAARYRWLKDSATEDFDWILDMSGEHWDDAIDTASALSLYRKGP